MVLVLTLLSIMAGVGANLLASLFDAYYSARAIAPAMSEGQLAMERMGRELRQIQFSNIDNQLLVTQSAITVTSVTGDLTVVGFYQSGSGDSTIRMVQNDEDRPLAQYVEADSLTFSMENYGDYSRLIMISFIVSATLPDGTDFSRHLSTAVYVGQ